MTTVRTILVPVDFSEGSRTAVRHARDLAATFGSTVHLLHVSPRPVAPAWAVELFGTHLRSIQQEERLKAVDQLATLMVAERLDPLSTTGLVRSGPPDEVIADYADEVHADLIVMGVHGDHMMPQPTVGHVAGRVLACTRCPVLAIPVSSFELAHLEMPSALPELRAS